MKNVRSLDSFSYLNMRGVFHLIYDHLFFDWVEKQSCRAIYVFLQLELNCCYCKGWAQGTLPHQAITSDLYSFFCQLIGIHCLISGTTEVFLWRSNRGTSTSEYFRAGNVNFEVCFQSAYIKSKEEELLILQLRVKT